MEGLEYELRHGIDHDETLKFKLVPSDVNKLTDEEKYWFELINEGAEDVFHFFQQLGFERSIIQTKLERPSHEVHDHDD